MVGSFSETDCDINGRLEYMKITIIHGQSHKGSTYHIARILAEKLHGEMTEFFLPRDFDSFCVGCTSCFMKGADKCPHYAKLQPITQAMDEADVLILASPVYVYHVTASMKAFLDHYGYRWMVHRPEERMFHKQAVCISTAAGAGMKSTNRDMADSLFFWGTARIYQYGIAVNAVSFDAVPAKKRQKLERDTDVLAKKILARYGRVTPSFKTKAFFTAMHFVQRKGWNDTDAAYWKEKGWTGKKRPWKE